MRLLWLVDSLKSAGLNVSPVKGWETRGSGFRFDPRVIVDHHTASRVGVDAPSLGVVVNGRPGIPAPLCNILTSRSGVVHVVASGISNNAGKGGYPSFEASYNRHTIGHEVEHAGVLTIEPVNPAQLEVVALVDATICRRMKWHASRCVAHKEWASPPGRKTDPVWPQDGHRARVAALLQPPQTGDDMPATIDLAGLVAYVDLAYAKAGRTPGEDLEGRLYWVDSAARSADPWGVLDQMRDLLAAGK